MDAEKLHKAGSLIREFLIENIEDLTNYDLAYISRLLCQARKDIYEAFGNINEEIRK